MEIVTWNLIVYKLLELDKNTWRSYVYKLFLFDTEYLVPYNYV